jgi:hypothetical protein
MWRALEAMRLHKTLRDYQLLKQGPSSVQPYILTPSNEMMDVGQCGSGRSIFQGTRYCKVKLSLSLIKTYRGVEV